ncbi:hypothetical protein EJ04DRAFT_118262 [Polyplosphaeria fusca]|uniref:Uncharacterized protein n=1 Tax=Polyplosphaeria fusca TaxID=682080 RepID=A0A9P4V5N9_9PLEO|nr:hypothetical protein EJ04DRAFT_118262 [Polyplosphaeria fusca]
MRETRSRARLSGHTPTQSLSPPTKPRSAKRTRAGKAKENNVEKEDEELGPYFQQPRPKRKVHSPMKEGMDLLIKIQKNKAACHPDAIRAKTKAADERRAAAAAATAAAEQNGIQENIAQQDVDMAGAPPVNQKSTSVSFSAVQAVPAVGSVASPMTPTRSGWSLGSLLGWFTKPKTPSTPVASSPDVIKVVAPATAPAVVIAPQPVEEFKDTLTPTPSRIQPPKTVKPRATTKAADLSKRIRAASTNRIRSKARRPVADPILVERILESIPKKDDQERGKPWVEENVIKLYHGRGAEDRRRRFDVGMKMSQLGEIPSRYPWDQNVSFGLLDEFFDDDSDDEEDYDMDVPLWYVLDLVVNERPSKKLKSTHGNGVEAEISSINDLTAAGVFDSQGTSASSKDIHPRPSCIPSPMFTKEPFHHPDRNIFTELSAQSPTPHDPLCGLKDRDAYNEQLRRTGHVEGSGDFCMPDFSDSDSDEEDEETQDTTWLKKPDNSQGQDALKPPPAPIPSHATLPNPITTRPTIPPIRSEDPVKFQRARAMKHTPAKPSRLREAMLPSPSIASEAGTPSASLVNVFLEGIPDPVAFDLGDPALDEMLSNIAADPGFAAKMTAAWGGNEVMMMEDEDDYL